MKRHLAPPARDLLVNSLINGRAMPGRLRGRALSWIGHEIDPTAMICPDVFLGSRRGLTVGARSLINYGCFFDLLAPTTLGDEVRVGYRVQFITGTHELGPSSRRAGECVGEAIVVEDGCWIGAGAIILPGTHIRSGVVVAAGSVVRGVCEADTLMAGVPASPRKSLL